MKTRLLFVTNSPIRGGTEKHLVDLVLRFDPSRTECVILCYGEDLFSAYLKNRTDVSVITLGQTKHISFVSYWAAFTKIRPHTILFVNAWLGLFPWYAYLAARLSGAKRLCAIEHIRADPPPSEIAVNGIRHYYRRLLGWRARYLWRIRAAAILSHQIICVSNAVRDRLINEYRYPERKTITIFNGVDVTYYRSNGKTALSIRAELDLDPSAPILVCISNLTVTKRIDILLEAMSMVVKDYPCCKCLILGYGPLESELRARTTELGLTGTVRFVGHVKDVRPYLEIADIFAMSSENEGLPLSIGEAMAYGVPSVVTDVGGNREIVIHGQTGLVVKPGSPEQLAQALNYLLVHPEERSRMGRNARERVREHFNIERTMGQLKSVLLDGGVVSEVIRGQ